MKAPTASELVEKLARENERMKILEILRTSETLEEGIKKVEALNK